LVDDYVPIDKRGQPLFCQPNKNEIWVPILEKAWAKANGSYANIVGTSIFIQLAHLQRFLEQPPIPQPKQ
jgi:hypothetical protein